MKLLLDTHTLIWAVDDPAQLGAQAVAELQDPTNELLLSAGSIWELAIKVGAKKLELSMPYRHHKDPFDRLLVAQSLYEQISIVSADPQLDAYGVTRIW